MRTRDKVLPPWGLAPNMMGSGVTNIAFASPKLATLNFSLNWTKDLFESLQTSYTENVFDYVM